MAPDPASLYGSFLRRTWAWTQPYEWKAYDAGPAIPPPVIVVPGTISGLTLVDKRTIQVNLTVPLAHEDGTEVDHTKYLLTAQDARTNRGVVPKSFGVVVSGDKTYLTLTVGTMSSGAQYNLTVGGVTGISTYVGSFTAPTNTDRTIKVTGVFLPPDVVVEVDEVGSWDQTESSTRVSHQEVRAVIPSRSAGTKLSIRVKSGNKILGTLVDSFTHPS